MLRIFLIALLLASPVLAKELIIKVTPLEKISTADENLQEGDYVNFKVVEDAGEKVKQNDIVTGLVTYLEPNGFFGKEAMLSIESFTTKDGHKLDGAIYAKGNAHNQVMEFNDFAGVPTIWVRGGEVKLLPEKDIFLLYLENKQ